MEHGIWCLKKAITTASIQLHWYRDLTLEPTGLFLAENQNKGEEHFRYCLDFVVLLFYQNFFLTYLHMAL